MHNANYIKEHEKTGDRTLTPEKTKVTHRQQRDNISKAKITYHKHSTSAKKYKARADFTGGKLVWEGI